MERSRMERWASTCLLILLACGFIAQSIQIRNLREEKERLLESIVEKMLLDYELEQIVEDLASAGDAEAASSLRPQRHTHVGRPSQEGGDKATTRHGKEHRPRKRGRHVEAGDGGKP